MPNRLSLGVAIFDAFADECEMLTYALSQSGFRVESIKCDRSSPDAPAMAAQLKCAVVSVVIWDISPASQAECNLFRTLNDAGAFANCSVALTTTHELFLRERFDCGSMPVFLKPYDLESVTAVVSLMEVSQAAPLKQPDVPPLETGGATSPIAHSVKPSRFH